MTDEILYLHHYDASPFTQKALKMLAIKGAMWRSVVQPMIAPKPDLVALTGGYRGTPVLQIGADIYVDSQLISEELERRVPGPTLYPGGKGVAHMLCEWSEANFRAGLDMAIRDLSPNWDPAFYRDRDAVFPDIDFAEADARYPVACARLRGLARFLNDQLADGRPFLMGAAPGLADIQGYVVNWFTRAAFPNVATMFAAFEQLPAWEARMAGLGEGRRIEATAAEAHEAARARRTILEPFVDPADPLGLSGGEIVQIAPETSARGPVRGRLLRLTVEEAAVDPLDARIKGVVVHFPRLGYRIDRIR